MAIHIKADAAGVISSILMIPDAEHVEFTGAEPSDLFDTFALGKYTFVNGALVETQGWVQPPAPQMPHMM